MTASGKRNLEDKGEITRIRDGINHPLFDSTVVLNVINQYSGFYAPSSAWVRLFRDSSLQEEILMHAYHAGPFDQLETLIKKAHAREEKHLPDTLIKAALQAMCDGDVAIKDDSNKVIYEGMTEKLLQLCNKLYSDLFSKTLFPAFQKEVGRILPPESKEQIEDKENRYRDKIKEIFKANEKNDSDTSHALETFNKWTENLSMADKFLLTGLAIDELANEGGKLKKVKAGPDKEDWGGWYGFLGDRFSNKVIWEALQTKLSPRLQQVLSCGVYYVFNPQLGRALIRSIDLDASVFASSVVGGFYNVYGGLAVGRRERWGGLFQNLWQAIASASRLYATTEATKSSLSAQLPGDVEIRRSHAAIAIGS